MDPFPAIPLGTTNRKMKNEMHEMTNEELGMVHGGWAMFLAGTAIAAGGYLVAGVIEHWEEFKKGAIEGYNTYA